MFIFERMFYFLKFLKTNNFNKEGVNRTHLAYEIGCELMIFARSEYNKKMKNYPSLEADIKNIMKDLLQVQKLPPRTEEGSPRGG